MQMTFEQAQRGGLLQAFATRGNGYMMRSEKRPGSYGGGRQPGRRPRRKRAGFFYIFLTLLVSIILWPVGMVMLWRRKVRMVSPMDSLAATIFFRMARNWTVSASDFFFSSAAKGA